MDAIYHHCPACHALIESRSGLAGFTTSCECGEAGILVPEQSTASAPRRSREEASPLERKREGGCFLCQQVGMGEPRYLRLMTLHQEGGFRVRRWVNVRCFCCDACSGKLFWRSIELYLIFLVSFLSSVGSCLLYALFFANAERGTWQQPVAIALLLAVLIVPMIGIFGGIVWHRRRLRGLTHPDAREQLDALLGTTEWWRLQIVSRVPSGEAVVECR